MAGEVLYQRVTLNVPYIEGEVVPPMDWPWETMLRTTEPVEVIKPGSRSGVPFVEHGQRLLATEITCGMVLTDGIVLAVRQMGDVRRIMMRAGRYDVRPTDMIDVYGEVCPTLVEALKTLEVAKAVGKFFADEERGSSPGI